MTNPVTQTLVRQLNDENVTHLVAHWDDLEALVINIYRAQRATPDDEADFALLRRWLQDHYLRWQDALQSYWQQTRVDGKLVEEDPFARLIHTPHAAAFVNDWQAMQMLPAARQALNEWLMDMLAS